MITLCLAASLLGQATTTEHGCGVISVYLLLRYSGKTTTLEEVARHITPVDGSSSMADLVRAARAFGFRLSAFRFVDYRNPPRFPFIMHLDYRNETRPGHFLFVNPIPGTKQFQVIDPPSAPYVVSARELLHTPFFQGVVLAQTPPFQIRTGYVVFGLGVLITVVAIVRILRHRWVSTTIGSY